MTVTVEELVYKLDADLKELKRSLKEGEASVDQSSNKISGSLGRVARKTRENVAQFEKWALRVGAAAAAAAAAFGAAKLIQVTREFDVLNAQLITATGSAEGAARAMGAIEDFAATTPFDLQQVTDSFTKLVNLGLTPSERALRSYGDTASAMGKDLNQLIEAVADAATGEFERLKEFGIKASVEGDKVAFRFRGQTTQITNDAASIEEFLIKLGENNFAGAMEQRMQTLDGAMSNLGDTVDKTFRALSESGIGDMITEGVHVAIDALEELTTQIESGQLLASLQAFGMQFQGLTQDAERSFLIISDLFGELSTSLTGDSDQLTNNIAETFSSLPESIRAFIQLMVTEVAAFVDTLGAYGEEALDNMKFWEDESFDLESRLAAIDEARRGSIETILAERDATVASVDEQMAKADELRAKFDEINAARAAQAATEGDRLAGFGVGATGEDAGGPMLTEAEQEKQDAKIQRLLDNYATEEELLLAKQQRELELIEQHEDRMTQLGVDAGALRTKIIADTERKQAEIQRKSKEAQLKQESEKWNLFARAASMGYQAIFGESKTAQIALAGINTATGITQALGSSPFPVNLANAAIVAAQGAAQINQIRSASIGSGVSAAGVSGAGGASAAAAVPPAQAQGSADDTLRQIVNVTLNGDNFGRDGIRDLLERIKEEVRDGGELGEVT